MSQSSVKKETATGKSAQKWRRRAEEKGSSGFWSGNIQVGCGRSEWVPWEQAGSCCLCCLPPLEHLTCSHPFLDRDLQLSLVYVLWTELFVFNSPPLRYKPALPCSTRFHSPKFWAGKCESWLASLSLRGPLIKARHCCPGGLRVTGAFHRGAMSAGWHSAAIKESKHPWIRLCLEQFPKWGGSGWLWLRARCYDSFYFCVVLVLFVCFFFPDRHGVWG